MNRFLIWLGERLDAIPLSVFVVLVVLVIVASAVGMWGMSRVESNAGMSDESRGWFV